MERVIDDIRIDGKWLKNFTLSKGVYCKTRSYYAWKSINSRCKNSGIKNKFYDFQEFAEFFQTLDYRMQREHNGKLWQVDKDFNLYGG